MGYNSIAFVDDPKNIFAIEQRFAALSAITWTSITEEKLARTQAALARAHRKKMKARQLDDLGELETVLKSQNPRPPMIQEQETLVVDQNPSDIVHGDDDVTKQAADPAKKPDKEDAGAKVAKTKNKASGKKRKKAPEMGDVEAADLNVGGSVSETVEASGLEERPSTAKKSRFERALHPFGFSYDYRGSGPITADPMACLNFFLRLKDHPSGSSTDASSLIRGEEAGRFAMDQARAISTILHSVCGYDQDVKSQTDQKAELESQEVALEAERKKSAELEIVAQEVDALKLKSQAAEEALKLSQADAEQWKLAVNHAVKQFHQEKISKDKHREAARDTMRRVNQYYGGLVEKMNRHLSQREEAEKIITTTVQWKGAERATEIFEKQGFVLPGYVKDKVVETARSWEARQAAFEEISFEEGELRVLTLDELFGEQRSAVQRGPTAPVPKVVIKSRAQAPAEKLVPPACQEKEKRDSHPQDAEQGASEKNASVTEGTEETVEERIEEIEKTGD